MYRSHDRDGRRGIFGRESRLAIVLLFSEKLNVGRGFRKFNTLMIYVR